MFLRPVAGMVLAIALAAYAPSVSAQSSGGSGGSSGGSSSSGGGSSSGGASSGTGSSSPGSPGVSSTPSVSGAPAPAPGTATGTPQIQPIPGLSTPPPQVGTDRPADARTPADRSRASPGAPVQVQPGTATAPGIQTPPGSSSTSGIQTRTRGESAVKSRNDRDSLAQCNDAWDKAAHISRQRWAQICREQAQRAQQVTR